MGTIWEITVATHEKSRQAVAAVMRDAFKEIERVENLLSDWRKGTELNQVNTHAGVQPVAVSEETFKVVERAYHFSEVSEGAFDITFNALWGVWDFNKKPPTLPDPEEIKERLPLINYRRLALNPKERTIFLKEQGMKIGLGGIAKGYTVDRVCALLERNGLKNYLVVGGGDMRVSGSRGKSPWRLAVRHPRKEGYLYLLDVTNIAVSTSGDYERYFILNGQRYHHIIDPKTGYPARGVSSVTVINPRACSMDADAMSTAVFVLGVEKGLRLLRQEKMEGIIVDENLRSYLTDGLKVDRTAQIPTVRLKESP
ncbi:MAG: FAD:protein FMN transferase [Abditibacteriales bacterium]|nr:FAD:protein FMN transferase [Abditibacteriales bacterium]